ncbi:hypothetical protein OPT61_g1435 [Boeremia exigua]|uniref:Uncharacterized protein n=1 Tax=Boeremia exigua TaxID=749465 RepID=A0ACC2IQ80_9PLEO|nr:hypothetical protein OPT61_g1435 [Boeremia exigua]
MVLRSEFDWLLSKESRAAAEERRRRSEILRTIHPVSSTSIRAHPRVNPLSLRRLLPLRIYHNGTSPSQLQRRRANSSQAHRIITQVVFSGARIIGRAVTESYRQAAASQKYAAANAGSGGSAFSSSNITMDEACKILNVGPGKGGIIEAEAVTERFKRLFDLNDPQKGGSFYLQSKILRARERIERELQGQQRMSEREAELRDGFKPKFTKEDK